MQVEFKGSIEELLLTKILRGFISLRSIAAKLLEGLEPSCLAKFPACDRCDATESSNSRRCFAHENSLSLSLSRVSASPGL